MPDALESLKTAKKVVGCKQTRRAIQEGRASVLFLADDADPMLTAPLALEATMQGIEIVRAPTMTALGRHCGISVSAPAPPSCDKTVHAPNRMFHSGYDTC